MGNIIHKTSLFALTPYIIFDSFQDIWFNLYLKLTFSTIKSLQSLKLQVLMNDLRSWLVNVLNASWWWHHLKLSRMQNNTHKSTQAWYHSSLIMMTQDRSSKHLFVDVVDHWPVEDVPGDLVHVVHLFSGTTIFHHIKHTYWQQKVHRFTIWSTLIVHIKYAYCPQKVHLLTI